MSQNKNSYPNLLLAASWRDVLRMVESKARQDVRRKVRPVAARAASSLGIWLVKIGEELRTTRR